MDLPDIYRGDYLKLAAVPLLLVLVAAYFIVQIEPGLEFKGGVLVTLELENSISEADLSALVSNAGFKDARVRAYELGDSHIAEIEIGHSNDMVELEKAYRNFLDLCDSYSKKRF